VSADISTQMDTRDVPAAAAAVWPGASMFRATQLRHPAGLASTSCGSFVPNDIALGGSAPGFILLTGPNMGGKSTLLRQVCLAAVLAQVRLGKQHRSSSSSQPANPLGPFSAGTCTNKVVECGSCWSTALTAGQHWSQWDTQA
jgi:hypothetical protein